MGRFATAAIIALALAGAGVESHADDLSGKAPVRGPARPLEQLLADAAPAPAPPAAPAADAPPLLPGAPPPGGPMGAMPRPPGPIGMGWGGRQDMRPDMLGAMWRMHQMEQTWGLFFNQRDKNLSNNDVQVLAEAILLVHGNHNWKVIDVADAADGEATFAFATADGSVIARFEIDRHSGRIVRIG
jgi:hypothetical protein